MSRPARPEDVDEICAALQETWCGTCWGDVPTRLVPHRDRGRDFVLYRNPHKTAIDPLTGQLAEVIRNAWRACAAKSLVKKPLGS